MAAMKICFPVRKQNGSEYSSPDEMMASIGREPHGSWLAGTNCLWHGGIHVSTVSAPGSVLTPDNVATAVPLQCMAKGEAVAWRLNKNYLTADYNGNSVRYSSSFILVKSVCRPDPQKTRGRLEFYTLYLGLAPLSAFPKKQCMKAKANVVKHPCGKFEDSRPANDVATISPGTAILPKDTRVIILREAQFRNDSTTQKQRGAVAPFGLAKSLNASGAATGEAFWVTMLPELMAPDGELYTHLPEWMARAVQQGEFNSVAKPATKLDIA